MTCSRCHRRLTRPIEHAGAIYGPRCAVVVGWVPVSADRPVQARRGASVRRLAAVRVDDPAQAVLFEGVA